MINEPRQEDNQSVQSETHLATRHDLIDAEIQHSEHIEQREDKGAPTDDDGSVKYKIQEIDVTTIVAYILVVHILSHKSHD